MSTSAPTHVQSRAASHPLLALSPRARRQLARTLVRGLEASREADRRAKLQGGLAGATTYCALGVAGFAAWHAATGGAAPPFLAFYGLLGTVQTACSIALERQGIGLGPRPIAAVLGAPRAVARAVSSLVTSRHHDPDLLVLAAGILVAARRPVSRQLITRLYGRAYAQRTVGEAVDLLESMGLVSTVRPADEPHPCGVVTLTPQGIQLLKSLGVTAPVARLRDDPLVAAHILPLFEALEGRARRLPAEPEPVLPPPPALELHPFPAVVELPALPPSLEVPELAPGAVEELPDEPELDDAPELAPAPARRRSVWSRVSARRLAWPVAIAAALALFGAIALHYPNLDGILPHHDELTATGAFMPGPSRGIALQFNGKGKLLSTYGGGLYLSIPDRLDYKTPVLFDGKYDMASDCGLVSRPLQRAAYSPQGRFLWCEMGGTPGTGPRERCLVDTETRTVTHDLVGRNPTYGLPGVIGWAGNQQLLMSEDVPPHVGGHWWLVDVTTHKSVPLHVPSHGLLVPLAGSEGTTMLAGWDRREGDRWDLSVYELSGQDFRPVTHATVTLPDGSHDAEPRMAAISPDRRFVLVSLRPMGLEVPAQGGSFVVVALSDGTTTPVATSVPPLPDQPVFWAPEAQGGHYRFYFNGGGPDGAVPCTGELTLGSS